MTDTKKQTCQCGARCYQDAYYTDEEPLNPCWGEVHVCDDFGDGEIMHACEGHKELWQDGCYKRAGA